MDPGSREALLRDFQRIVKEARVTTVFVTHDRAEAFALADRVGIMADGRMLQLGAREEVFLAAGSQTVAEIVGVENCLPGRVQETDGAFSTIAIGTSIIRLPRGQIAARHTSAGLRAGGRRHAGVRPSAPASDSISLRGNVIDVSPGVLRHRVTLQCGDFCLVAVVDRKNGLEGSLGGNIAASFNAAAAHVIAGEMDR